MKTDRCTDQQERDQQQLHSHRRGCRDRSEGKGRGVLAQRHSQAPASEAGLHLTPCAVNQLKRTKPNIGAIKLLEDHRGDARP